MDELAIIDDYAEAKAYKLSSVGIDSKCVPIKTWRGGDLVEVREEMEEAALERANQLGGVQRFILEIVGNDGGTEASTMFRVTAEALPGVAGTLATEPPTGAGHQAQMMRQNEAFFRLATIANGKSFAVLERIIDRTEDRADKADARWLETLQFVQEAIDLRETARKTERREERKVKILEKAGKTIVDNIPIALNAFANKKAPEGAMHTAAALAKTVFDDLEQDQFSAMLSILGEAKARQVVSLMQTLNTQEKSDSKNETPEGGATAGGKPDGRH